MERSTLALTGFFAHYPVLLLSGLALASLPRAVWSAESPANERATAARFEAGKPDLDQENAIASGRDYPCHRGPFGSGAAVDCGRTLWRASWRWGCSATLAVAAGKVVAVGGAGECFCLDATTGKELWRRNEEAQPSAKYTDVICRRSGPSLCRWLFASGSGERAFTP